MLREDVPRHILFVTEVENFLYLCYDVNMWSIYGMDIRLLKEHPEYKEQIKLLPTQLGEGK